MIKNTGRSSTRVLITLLTMIFFIACHKDDETQDQLQNSQVASSSVSTSKVSIGEIPQVMKYVSSISNNDGQFIISKVSTNTRSNETDLVIGEIQTSEIIKITDQYDRSNYTFLLTSIESANSTFNLIIKESGVDIYSYIMEYRPDVNWVPDYRNPENFSTFSGEIVYYNVEGAYLGKEVLSNGEVASSETKTVCPDPNSDTSDGPGDGGSDGSTDGGNDGSASGSGIEIISTTDCNVPCKHPEHNPHATPCTHPICETTIEVVFKSSVQVEKHMRNPCPPDVPVVCHEVNGDVCPLGCNADNSGCMEDPNPVGVIYYDLANIVALNEALEENPFLLLEIDCDQIQNWQILAQHTANQSIQDKIDALPDGTFNDFEIQSLEDARGNTVNLDFFSVNISSLPNNPNTGQQFSPEDFLDYFRRNINDFVDDSTFDPYCQIDSICQQETDLWNSSDPTGALVYIDIPGDDGTVICSEFQSSYWYFMTLNAPYSGNHPVSGTREFGFEQNTNGSFNFFVRGVDRFDSNWVATAAYVRGLGNPFFGADDLWESFQEKTNQFINDNGGSSSITPPTKNRPDWDKVDEYLKGQRPIADLGCN